MKDDLLDEILQDNRPFKEEDEILRPLLEEIDLIDDPNIMSFVRAVLIKAPTYFWTVPSDFVDHHHPPDESKEGGLVLHTQRVVRLAREMTAAQDRGQEELDLITAAALIHDITKATPLPDGSYIYDSMHPYTVDTIVRWVRQEDKGKDESHSSSLWISEEDMNTILRMVRCHKGSWSPVPETIPVTSLELTLHLADLLASKMHIMLDGDIIKEGRWSE